MAGFSELYLDYRAPNGRRGTSLLWPVWIWRVHVPDGRHTDLNALARAVLALHACGRNDLAWMAQWLGLDHDLVRYIAAAELAANDWIDARGRLTDSGRERLDGKTAGRVRQRAGLLFQSATSGELWPRLRSSLHEIEPDAPASYPRFTLDRDSGRVLKPFRVDPEPGRPQRPTVADILAALQLDRIARHQQQQRQTYADDPAADDESDEPPASAIEYIEDQPQPAWVLCEVWRSPETAPPWRVGDPLGRSPAADWMRREVHEASRRLPALARRLGELLGEIDPALDWETCRRQQDEGARFEVLTDFPQAAQVPGLEDALIGLLRLQATVTGGGGRREEREALLVQSQKALETVLVECLRRWPLAQPQRRIDRNWRLEDIHRALACAAPDVDRTVIDAIRLQPGKLFQAAAHHRGSLRQYLAALLLSFTDHPQHPFRPLARDGKRMQALLGLSHARDAAGHGGKAAPAPDNTVSLQHADTALHVIQTLIEGM